MTSAVPIYNNSRPYQQLVFQYSLHIEHKNGGIIHKEYLAEADQNIDPRDAFIKQLIEDCGTTGDILVYNIGFERGKLNDLIALYPEYAYEINNILEDDGDPATNGLDTSSGVYWTSTEYAANEAYDYSVITGVIIDDNKGSSYRVRAIRAF